ncbi:MAG: hypothetical protein QOH06_1561 [Acidobacteriota bacterium]|jgi:fumarylacetoacetate (FAA) hydrolase family protein|nr:hypothetical protein [Acidobacteriota bacterium]
MSSNLPVAEMVAHLQQKIAHHKEQMDAHAKQEALHGGKRALHEAEHRKAVERCEALQAASAAAGELLKDVKGSAPRSAPARKEVKGGGWHWLADLLERVIETKAPGEAFGATSLVDEILERWGSKLRDGIDIRSAQTTLRRWARDGVLDVVREGRSKHEALYTRPRE